MATQNSRKKPSKKRHENRVQVTLPPGWMLALEQRSRDLEFSSSRVAADIVIAELTRLKASGELDVPKTLSPEDITAYLESNPEMAKEIMQSVSRVEIPTQDEPEEENSDVLANESIRRLMAASLAGERCEATDLAIAARALGTTITELKKKLSLENGHNATVA